LNSPFNGRRYKALLEGLEVSEVRLSATLQNKDSRIDSDFWTKTPKKNPQLQYRKIGDILVSSQYGISIAMNEDNKGFPIYRMNEIHNMLCDLSVDKCADITPDIFCEFELKDRDVLFNRTNSFEWVGRTGLYYQNDNIKRTFASYLVRFNPDENVVLPEYLTVFLNTKQGIQDIKRRSRQSINQTNVNPEEVKEIEIPLLPIVFQNKIKACFELANTKRIEAQSLYRQAEDLLADAIGLKGFTPSAENTSVRSFSQSFLQTGRLDAEYYQREYEDNDSLIRRYPKGFETVRSACTLKDSNYEPLPEQEYQYIELADIGAAGNITGCTAALGSDLPSRARRTVATGDVIISSIEGSLQSCALVPAEYSGALCSTGFYVVRSDKINSETLLVLFKSAPLQNLLKQGCSGTILTAINKQEFLNLPLPLIDADVQRRIVALVQKSFAARRESERLLEEAKARVEAAVEEADEW